MSAEMLAIDELTGQKTEEVGGDHGGSRLFADDTSAYGIGRAERRAIATLEALHAVRQFTPVQQMLAETARSLAQNMDAGNRKGRAIGNEAMQLAAVLAQLTDDGLDDDGTGSNLPAEVQELLVALSTAPRAPVPA